MSKVLQVAHADIIFENFEGDLVVLDLRSGRYFGCNPLAAKLWNSLIRGADPESLIHAGLSRVRLEAFLARLAELGLAFMQDGVALVSQESFAADLAEDWAGEDDPEIESFDDMADLMQADPIHEVDEHLGWPHRREND